MTYEHPDFVENRTDEGMNIRLFGQQLLRSKTRTVLYLVVLAAATAFFVMSANLYRNSVENLNQVEETYSTIAVMELYGDVDRYGQLTAPDAETYDGYYSVGVNGYDFSSIVSTTCVEDYDLRARYAAYIPGRYARRNNSGYLCSFDHIRFKILSEEPVELMIWPAGDIDHDFQKVPVEVTYSATGLYNYGDEFELDIAMTESERQYYSLDIQKFNWQEISDRIILYPNTEYYMVGTTAPGGEYFYPMASEYGEDHYLSYFKGFESTFSEPVSKEHPNPFYMQRWEDLQSDRALRTFFENAEAALRYTVSSFCVVATNDIMGIPAFHLGGAQLYAGRFISEAEYASGAKICMISQTFASKQLLEVGDTLDMHFYQFDAFPNADMDANTNRPVYTHDTGNFFDQGVYEIVGIYSNRGVVGNSTISESATALPWFNIFVPHKSLRIPDSQSIPFVHGNLLTIWLENGSINEFLDHVNALGITEERADAYQASFTFYDQGYSLIQPSLQTMHETAKLLLILSSALLVATVILIAWFFAQSQKASVGILRMLGGRKRQAAAGLLLCAMLIALVSAAAGCLCGGVLTQAVGERMLRSGMQDSTADAEFRAFILAEQTTTDQIAAETDLTLSVQAGCLGALLFLVCVCVFVGLYITREPRELLPKNKA